MNAGDKSVSIQGPVLILGAGINGCALARELALNGVGCWLVDVSDVASGATAGSSRLIHGGLRYLEFGDFQLVKESLGERRRLLQLAPQFVRPLRLWIPLQSRLGGALGAPGRFFGWRWWPTPQPKHGRGVTLIRAGLALYDAYARDPALPKHQIVPVAAASIPVDRKRYRWLGAYSDGQVTFPERLLVALLQDAQQLATEQGLDFRVLNYHTAVRSGNSVRIEPQPGTAGGSPQVIEPVAIVNATGAWVDETLAQLEVPSPRLMGGTKGSHLFSFSPRLIQELQGQGLYTEAPDGRPIFITPLGRAVLIGTTDERFTGDPRTASISEQEATYLLAAVNRVLPDVRLERSDIDFHYSAVRPLPYTDAATPAAISRRHALVEGDVGGVPLLSLVGGKLTTMRSLAEEAAARLLARLGRPVRGNSRDRMVPGGENYPPHDTDLTPEWQRIAERTGFGVDSVAAVWQLVGTRAEAILCNADILGDGADRELLADTALPCAFARWSIRHEWATTLADLVERRLMLLYHQRLTKRCLTQLGRLLAEAGKLSDHDVETAVDQQVERLGARYGKHVA